MAHYVASINLFEHADGPARASVKLFRVFDYGARPTRPVWEAVVNIEPPTEWSPTAWLLGALTELIEQLPAR